MLITMEKFCNTPDGVAEGEVSRNNKGMAKSMHGHGWRKPTSSLGIAEQHAQAGERVSVPKNKALLAIKRVAASLDLKPSDMMLLDTFGAFTKPQDWEEGRRPIVWASNAYLMEQTGFSLSALRRHARRLVDAGLIAFKDSSNGKRWGHRDDQDYIIEAYGYDLSPLAARAEEFVCIFRDIRPPIPTTSAHLYRGIRPALTRCREALVFDISFLAFRHVVEGLSFGRIVRRVRAGRRCAPAGLGWHLRRWVHQ